LVACLTLFAVVLGIGFGGREWCGACGRRDGPDCQCTKDVSAADDWIEVTIHCAGLPWTMQCRTQGCAALSRVVLNQVLLRIVDAWKRALPSLRRLF